MAAALVGPAFGRSFGQLRLRAAARELAALCRFARTQAITHQSVMEVVLVTVVQPFVVQLLDVLTV